jgi:hypothetical protein
VAPGEELKNASFTHSGFAFLETVLAIFLEIPKN